MRGSYNRPITNRYHAAKEPVNCAARLQAAGYFVFPFSVLPAVYVCYSFVCSACSVAGRWPLCFSFLYSTY